MHIVEQPKADRDSDYENNIEDLRVDGKEKITEMVRTRYSCARPDYRVLQHDLEY